MKLSSPASNMKFTRISTFVFMLAILFLLLPHFCFADVMENGKASVNYETSFFSSTPSDKVKAVALKLAKRQAWEKYTQSFSPAKLALYRKIEQKILDALDIYLLKVSIIDEETDSDNHRYSVVVRVSINEARLQTVFADASSKSHNRKKSSANLISYLFVAREQSSVTSFDKTKMKTQVNRDGQQLKSGSSETIADKVDYRLISAANVDTAMNQVFSSAGLEVVNYEDVVNSCGGTEPREIRETFTVSESITRDQRKKAIIAARNCDVTYFAVGTLDVVMADTDPVTGNKRVYVSVRSQVWNIENKLPKQISSVGPVQYQGLGPNNLVAQNNALSLATENVAKEIISQLNAKGMH